MQQTALILSISSDIGTALAYHYIELGWQVAGTYRTNSSAVKKLESLGIKMFECDLSEETSVDHVCFSMGHHIGSWDALFICVGNLEPIGNFHEIDFDQWQTSLQLNLLAPLRVVRNLLNFRNLNGISAPSVLFFAGGGTNSAPVRFSAYTVSKIALIKMCELLDAEIPDAHFVIVGPGWVRTKIHKSTLTAKHLAGNAYNQTVSKFKEDNFVSIQKVIKCCDWAINAPKEIVSGRNLSVEHDLWGSLELDTELRNNPNMFKLRRDGNSIKFKTTKK